MEKVTTELTKNIAYCNEQLQTDTSYDVLFRRFYAGKKECCIYYINGFLESDSMQDILKRMTWLPEDYDFTDLQEFSKKYIPYSDVQEVDKFEDIFMLILSGVVCMFVDGLDKALKIDCRSYPQRGVEEPAKDKVLRGSRDGFVETLVLNTALVRRRIRSPQLVMKMLIAGEQSKTNIVVSYLKDRVDKKLLDDIVKRIENLNVDALTLNHESLAECLFQHKWINPFPKCKFSERPDTTAACILEGNIVIFVDNSPSAMIIPTSVFDIIEQADDYYFPPITGTYLRFTRFIVAFITLAITPIWLLMTQNPDYVPESCLFIMIKEDVNIPVIMQFLILEIAIDGLRLAAVNTPNMLNTPLSIMAGLVLGDFSVSSGWFNSEVMLYMAFVAVASYSQTNYELGYALKFLRVITLILTAAFNVVGFVLGWVISSSCLLCNKTISGRSYLYPLIPFHFEKVVKRFLRFRIPYNDNGKAGKKY